MANRRRATLTITDPRALRAFAHPARQRLFDELMARATLTATEAAKFVGLSPSATSHHLRALEKYGLAVRASSSDDGRERPWRAASVSIDFEAGRSAAGQAAVQTLVASRLDHLREQVAAYSRSAADDPWQDLFRGLSWHQSWVTESEARQLAERLKQALESLPPRRTTRRRPAGARHISVAVSVLPVQPPKPKRR